MCLASFSCHWKVVLFRQFCASTRTLSWYFHVLTVSVCPYLLVLANDASSNGRVHRAFPTYNCLNFTVTLNVGRQKIWKGNPWNVWLSGRYQQPMFGKSSGGIQWRSSDIQLLTCCSSPFLSLSSQTHTLVWLISAFMANAFHGTKWHRPWPHAANGDTHAAHTCKDAALTGNGFVWGRFLPSRVPVVLVDRDGLKKKKKTLVSIYRKPQRKPPWPRANEKHGIRHTAFPTTLTSWSSALILGAMGLCCWKHPEMATTQHTNISWK